MRRTKLAAVVASLAVTSGGAAVIVAAPAAADDTPTTVSLSFTDPDSGKSYTGWRVLYGDTVAPLAVTISDGTDTAPPVGAATLQRRLPGKDWKDQETDEDLTDGVAFSNFKALSNAGYRVQYSGGTDDTTEPALTTSNTVKVLAYWNFKPTKAKYKGGLAFKWWGALAPHVKHHRVVIQVKHGTWKKYKVVRTNARSRWSVRVKAGHNHWVRYRAVVAGTKKLHKNGTAAKFMVTFSRTPVSHRSSHVLTQR